MKQLSFNADIVSISQDEKSSLITFKAPKWMFRHLNELDKTKGYNLKIATRKHVRTLAQNNYAWAVMTKIAQESDIFPDKNAVYRAILHRAKIQVHQLLMTKEAAEALAASTGVLELVEKNYSGKGADHYMWMPGISTFDRDQMMRFIEAILYFAYEYGVDVSEFENYGEEF